MPLVRPCRNRWCPEYADETGFCPAHARPMFAGQPPMPPGWAAIRAAQLAQFPLCAGCSAPAVEVHHLHGREANQVGVDLLSLCHGCHATITGTRGGTA